MTTAQTAWLAGFYEGEGCLAFTGRNSVVLQIISTDEDVIRHCQKVTGVGQIYGPYKNNRANLVSTKVTKPVWYWAVSRKDILVPLLTAILPWLGSRRSHRVMAALERLEGMLGSGPRDKCREGHDMTGYNRYVSPSGASKCRICSNKRKRDKHKRVFVDVYL